ncbi:MAG: hypothetical protein Fur0014_08490 [Rubrivivax sp.]
MSARLPKHLDDAAHAAQQALDFLGGRSLDHYRGDAMLRSAVERQVEIVGEACRRALEDEPGLKARLPEAALAIAMRNRIAHGYDTVDDGIVHETVSTRFAPLLEALQRELRALGRH